MNRPYTIISSAMSADGKISGPERMQRRLSNDEDFRAVDRLRSEMDAILVGSTTVNNDNPSLVLKYEENRQRRIDRGVSPDPIKVAISRHGHIPLSSSFIQKGRSEKIIFTTGSAPDTAVERLAGVATVVTSDSPRVDVRKLLSSLHDRGIRKLLIEGGGETNAAFLNEGLVDELRIAIAPVIIGGRHSPTLADGPGISAAVDLEFLESIRLGDMMILRYRPRPAASQAEIHVVQNSPTV